MSHNQTVNTITAMLIQYVSIKLIATSGRFVCCMINDTESSEEYLGNLKTIIVFVIPIASANSGEMTQFIFKLIFTLVMRAAAHVR